jgi:solute carrier family 32 (vesicular inhibitory amino acid transporter)
LLVCFIICTFSYGLMGVIGYLMYSESLKSQVTLNLPSKNIGSTIAIYTTLINPFTKFALLITPIAEAIEDSLHIGKNMTVSIFIRTALVVSTTMVALVVPFFAYVVALTGSFLSSTVTMLLPCVCYLKIISSRTSTKLGLELGVCSGIIMIGLGVIVIGTYSSLQQIIHSF